MSNPIETIPYDLQVGQIAMYLAGNAHSQSNALKGGNVDNRLQKMLTMEQYIIQNIYNLNPNDSNLRKTTNYLYSLYGIWGTLAKLRLGQLAQTPPTITNPANVSIQVGQNATFSVTVTSSLAYTVQWYRNGVAIPGANSNTYTLPNAQLTDSGATFSATASSIAGSASSTNASLTVTLAITGQYYYGDTDYFALLNAGTDTVPYNATFNITTGNPLIVPFPLAAANNKYNVIKYPDSQSDKTIWYNTVLNNGTIPDSVYRAIISFGGNKYIISRNAMSLDSTNQTVTYS